MFWETYVTDGKDDNIFIRVQTLQSVFTQTQRVNLPQAYSIQYILQACAMQSGTVWWWGTQLSPLSSTQDAGSWIWDTKHFAEVWERNSFF